MSENIDNALNYLIQGDVELAKKYYELEIKSNKNVALAHAGLANCYAWQNNLNMARQEIRLVEAMNIDIAMIFVAKGMILSKEEDTKTANSMYMKAVEIEPDSPYILYSYATYLLHQGQVEESIDLMEKAQKIDKGSWIISQNLASIYYLQKNFSKSFLEALYCLRIKPSFSIFQLMLVSLLQSYPILKWLVLLAYLPLALRPRSGIALFFLISSLLLIIAFTYSITRKQSQLILGLVTIIIGLSYYLIYIR